METFAPEDILVDNLSFKFKQRSKLYYWQKKRKILSVWF